MAEGATGFGALPGVEGDQGVTPQPPASLDTLAHDIHEIKHKYCDGDSLEYEQVFNLGAVAPGNFNRLDFSQSPFNTIIVSVITGSVNIFFGDFSGDVTSTPHIQVGSGTSPQFMLTTKGRVISLINPSAVNPATGCLTVMKI